MVAYTQAEGETVPNPYEERVMKLAKKYGYIQIGVTRKGFDLAVRRLGLDLSGDDEVVFMTVPYGTIAEALCDVEKQIQKNAEKQSGGIGERKQR